MRNLFALLVPVLLAVTPVRASAQELVNGVSVALGDAVTVQLEEGGSAVVIARQPAGLLTDTEIAMIQHLAQLPYDVAGGPNAAPVNQPEGMPELRDVPRGQVHIRFAQVPGTEQVVLLIENGYGQAFVYRATQHVDGAASPTDVCSVRPNFRAFEHWPYVIQQIDLTAISLEPMGPDDPVVCR